MTRRSVTSRMRRHDASPRSCCAPRALIRLFVAILWFAIPEIAAAQNPALPPPAAESNSAANRTTPPAIPPQPPVDASISPKPPATPPAAPKESEDLDTALAQPGDLNLHGLSLNAALFMIGEQWNINIVAGDLQGNVNGVFKQAPLREILDAILLSNGYNYREVGKSLVVSSVADLGQVNPFFQSATIPVQNADIEEVVQGAQLLTTPKGQVRPLKSAHSIVVLDFPDRVKMIREFVATLDNAGNGRFPSAENRNGVPLEVGYFRTQHIAAKTAEIALQAVLSKEGRVAVMEKEDCLLVTDYAENLSMVEKVLARIDHPRPQVRIKALLYDISLEDVERMGFNWNPILKGRYDAAGEPQSTLDIESVTTVPLAAGAAGNTLTFTNLSKNLDLTAVVQCIQNAKDARLLSDPNIAVLDNEEAVLEQVQEIPYQQLTQTQQGGNIGTTAFKKAGITLHVRPKIAADGVIRMEVRPEVSRLTGFTPGDNQPIISISSASTTLTIANKQLVVIGGLRQRDDVGEFNGVPYLKDLQVVGRFFRSRDTEVRERELVVFIMPEIIPYDDDPNCRQLQAGDTVDCRLDQIPVAEGCPPCCRRLPPGALLDPNSYPNYDPASGAPMNGDQQFGAPMMSEPGSPAEMSAPFTAPQNIGVPAEGLEEVLPTPTNVGSPEPMSATQIPSAEFQFGVAGRNEQVRVLVDDGRLRRLPVVVAVKDSPIIGNVRVERLFNGPSPAATAPAPAAAQQPRLAESPASTPVRR
jgi:general secretion pathway protein D